MAVSSTEEQRRGDTGKPRRGGYSYSPSDEAILRFLALPDEHKLLWVWEMNALLAQAPPETRRLHELFRRGEI